MSEAVTGGIAALAGGFDVNDCHPPPTPTKTSKHITSFTPSNKIKFAVRAFILVLSASLVSRLTSAPIVSVHTAKVIYGGNKFNLPFSCLALAPLVLPLADWAASYNELLTNTAAAATELQSTKGSPVSSLT